MDSILEKRIGTRVGYTNDIYIYGSRKLFFEFQVSSISALLVLILFTWLVQVQGEYIFREIESTFAPFDQTKRKSLFIKVYIVRIRIIYGNEIIISEWREWPYYSIHVNRKIKLFRVRMALHCK